MQQENGLPTSQDVLQLIPRIRTTTTTIVTTATIASSIWATTIPTATIPSRAITATSTKTASAAIIATSRTDILVGRVLFVGGKGLTYKR